MKTDRQKPNCKLALSLQIQDQKNPGPLQTEAQRLTMWKVLISARVHRKKIQNIESIV